jgi:hypothetical protein
MFHANKKADTFMNWSEQDRINRDQEINDLYEDI